MRPKAPWEDTCRASARIQPKSAARHSRGEKRNRKQMAASVASRPRRGSARTRAESVASQCPCRGSADLESQDEVGNGQRRGRRRPRGSASLREGRARWSSDHQRTWIALVDQSNHQIDLTNSVVRKRQPTEQYRGLLDPCSGGCLPGCLVLPCRERPGTTGRGAHPSHAIRQGQGQPDGRHHAPQRDSTRPRH
jgi:hypothetical protein